MYIWLCTENKKFKKFKSPKVKYLIINLTNIDAFSAYSQWYIV